MSRAIASKVSRQIFQCPRLNPKLSRPYDVFINHRGIDTKQNVAGLLYHSLSRYNVRAFLDSESMKPGDRLFEMINAGIRESKIGVTIFSPNYCNSYFCLHELALIMESKKKVIPIFCDMKPSDLLVYDNGQCFKHEITRFRRALEEARYTVGITFDSHTGNWPDLIRRATDIVVSRLVEMQEEEEEQEHAGQQRLQPIKPFKLH